MSKTFFCGVACWDSHLLAILKKLLFKLLLRNTISQSNCSFPKSNNVVKIPRIFLTFSLENLAFNILSNM